MHFAPLIQGGLLDKPTKGISLILDILTIIAASEASKGKGKAIRARSAQTRPLAGEGPKLKPEKTAFAHFTGNRRAKSEGQRQAQAGNPLVQLSIGNLTSRVNQSQPLY